MDWSLFDAVNRLARHTHWAHSFMKFYANNGVVLFALLLAWAAIAGVRHRDPELLSGGVWAAIAAVVALALNQPIANLVGRARPYQTHPSILTLVDRGTDPSFMSDHSIVAAAVAGGLLLVAQRIGLIAVVGAIIMGFVRVYVGAHYPGDVVAGWIFGATIALAGARVAGRVLVPAATRVLDWPIVRRFEAVGGAP